MLRHKVIGNLAAPLAIALLGLATLAEAEFCLWCDPVKTRIFVICVTDSIKNDPRFTMSAEALDDMKGSIIAASQAMKRSSQSTKMNMMNGAMAGELTELIKSQSTTGYSGTTMSYVMEIVGGCYVGTTGQPHYTFMQDIGKTVNFMLNGDSPSYSDPGSYSEPSPPQNPAQTFVNSAADSMAANYSDPGRQTSLPQPVSNILFPNDSGASDLFLPFRFGIPYASPLAGVIPSASLTNPQTGLYYPVGTAGDQDGAVNLNYSSDKKDDGPSVLPRSNSPNIAPNQFTSNAAPSYDYGDQRNLQSFIPLPPAIPQQTDSSAGGGASTFTLRDQGFPTYYPTNQLVQNSNSDKGVLKQNGVYPFNNVNNFPDKADQITSGVPTDYGHQPDYNYYPYNPALPKLYDYSRDQPGQPALGDLNRDYAPLPVLNNYPPPNNAYGTENLFEPGSENKPQQNYNVLGVYPPDSFPSSFSVVKSDNVQGTNSGEKGLASDNFRPNDAAQAENGEYPVSQPEPEPESVKLAPATNKVKSDEQKSSPSDNGDDDGVARAMKFAETVYVIFSQSNKFKSIFNKRTSNSKAVSYTLKIIRGALKDCGYSEAAGEIAKSISDAVKSLPQKCPTVQYAEAISKSLMDEFYAKKLIAENPESQAKSITTAFLTRLKKKKTSGSGKTASKEKESSRSVVSTSTNSESQYPVGTDVGGASSNFEYKNYQNNPKATDGKENYDENSNYGGLLVQKSNGGNSNYDDSSRKQLPDINYDYFNRYNNYPNPAANYPDSQQTGSQNQKPTRQNISPKDNPEKDYNNQNPNYNYDDYYNEYNYDNQPSIGNADFPNDNYNRNNDNNNQYYGNSDNRNARPNQKSTEETDQSIDDYNYRKDNNFPQNADDYKYSESNIRQPDHFYGIQKSSAGASSLSSTDKQDENPIGFSDTASGTSEENVGNSQSNPEYGITLKKNIQSVQSEFADSTGKEDDKQTYSEKELANPDSEKEEKRNRIYILMKWALSSISEGIFNYKIYANVIAALAKYLQNTHPEWGSNKCFFTILIEALVACTQLLAKIPPEYLAEMSIPEINDAADETMGEELISTLKLIFYQFGSSSV